MLKLTSMMMDDDGLVGYIDRFRRHVAICRGLDDGNHQSAAAVIAPKKWVNNKERNFGLFLLLNSFYPSRLS